MTKFSSFEGNCFSLVRYPEGLLNATALYRTSGRHVRSGRFNNLPVEKFPLPYPLFILIGMDRDLRPFSLIPQALAVNS